MKMRMKAEMLCRKKKLVSRLGSALNETSKKGHVQADNTPQNDDVKVEDVRYAEREAEDYAKHAGPNGDGCVSSFRSAHLEVVWQAARAYHWPYIPIAIE